MLVVKPHGFCYWKDFKAILYRELKPYESKKMENRNASFLKHTLQSLVTCEGLSRTLCK